MEGEFFFLVFVFRPICCFNGKLTLTNSNAESIKNVRVGYVLSAPSGSETRGCLKLSGGEKKMRLLKQKKRIEAEVAE